ncbi:hypothetical protein [Nocardia cyriacigeorgica]|uniref:hypothetical protein n=1 Tax=Nocardia cyriacigeorgica TaxID=135487 RepID=UPI002457D249|nr:hypothetical protein [Nocardia cyriacigeorgica]
MADHAESVAPAGDTDPAYAPEREHFIGYTHQEIWDRVHEVMDPAALDRAAAVWRANAVAVGEAFRAFGAAADREFARWSGQTADAAAQATREFIRVGTDAHDVCAAVAALLEFDRDAAQTVRAAIVPPEPYRPLDDPAAEAIHGGQRRMDHDIAAAAVTADVQDLMTHVYSPAIPASGDRVPRFAVTRTAPTGGGSQPL